MIDEFDVADPSSGAEGWPPSIYCELRRLAVSRLRKYRPNQTLNATALVHEVYLRLAQCGINWHSRAHYFAVASEAMRSIVIDNYRRKHRIKRGKGFHRMDIDITDLAARDSGIDLLAVDEAITALEAIDPVKARLVKLRCFVGMTLKEASEVVGVSVPTAERYWRYARAFLANELQCVVRKTNAIHTSDLAKNSSHAE